MSWLQQFRGKSPQHKTLTLNSLLLHSFQVIFASPSFLRQLFPISCWIILFQVVNKWKSCVLCTEQSNYFPLSTVTEIYARHPFLWLCCHLSIIIYQAKTRVSHAVRLAKEKSDRGELNMFSIFKDLVDRYTACCWALQKKHIKSTTESWDKKANFYLRNSDCHTVRVVYSLYFKE